jgi:hypothetical protein
MNADELRSRRREIVESVAKRKRGIDECLSELESLDAAALAPHNAYYDFINQFDTLYRLFKAAEGRPQAQDATAEMMMSALDRFRKTLPKPETMTLVTSESD